MNSSMEGAKNRFKKIVVNNGDGRRVQVIAWGQLTTKLNDIDKDGTVVHITSVVASAPKDAKFNSGNVAYELLIKSNSRVNILGMFQDDGIPELAINRIKLAEIGKFLDKTICKIVR